MPELQAGSTFGPYRVVAPLGRGGMASVYTAYDPHLDRRVALKVLPAEFLRDGTFAERFRREAQVAARLEHPHIVPIHAFGIEDGVPWMSMRLVTGGAWAARLATGVRPAGEVLAVLRDVAAALDYAHAHGIVHRDVKPPNVLLDDAGRAYLADFGIARLLEGAPSLTATGLIAGTPSYMAPEQALGQPAGPATDVYALTVVAYEALSGRVPFEATTPVAVLMKHVQEAPPRALLVPPSVAAVLERGLAKDPLARWLSCGAFVAALEQAFGATASAPTLASREPAPTLAADGVAPLETTRAASPEGVVATQPARAPSRFPWGWIVAAGGLLLAVVALGLGIAVWRFRPTPAPAQEVTPPTTRPDGTPRPETPTAPPEVATPEPHAARQGPRTATMAPATPVATPAPSSTARPVSDEESPPATPISTPVAAAPVATLSARAPVTGPVRVFCEARLEPWRFKGADAGDVADSLRDLRNALARREGIELVTSAAEAEVVVQVLERGRAPAVIGARIVRVRVVVGSRSLELEGRDALFNTWKGAAGGVAKQIERWIAANRDRLRR